MCEMTFTRDRDFAGIKISRWPRICFSPLLSSSTQTQDQVPQDYRTDQKSRADVPAAVCERSFLLGKMIANTQRTKSFGDSAAVFLFSLASRVQIVHS